MTTKCLLGLLLGVVLAPAAFANKIEITPTFNASSDGGGEFTAKTTPTAILGLSRFPGTFQTFCVESTVFLQKDTEYNFAPTQADHSGVTLKLGTAWLFNAFSSGTMSDYDYHQDSGNVKDAKAMQAAIWYFQGQPAPSAAFNVSSSNKFVKDALNALGASAASDANAAFNVWILGLSDDRGKAVQDLLGQFPDPVPDGGMTIALLGFVLVGLEGLRRKVG